MATAVYLFHTFTHCTMATAAYLFHAPTVRWPRLCTCSMHPLYDGQRCSPVLGNNLEGGDTIPSLHLQPVVRRVGSCRKKFLHGNKFHTYTVYFSLSDT